MEADGRDISDMTLVLCKQKMAYEVRVSDWSSDGCASDLTGKHFQEIFLTSDAGVLARLHGRPMYPLHLAVQRPLRVAFFDFAGNVECRLSRIHVPKQHGRASCRERVCQYV